VIIIKNLHVISISPLTDAIITSTSLRFSEICIASMNMCISLANQQMPKVLKVPDHIVSIAETIPTINGTQTLQGTAKIWWRMVRLPNPFPSFSYFIPAVFAFWNAVKGGSDTTTKLMDDCIICVPKIYLNTETVTINYLLSLIFCPHPPPLSYIHIKGGYEFVLQL
jgi:hypothetical protein